ncbi:hypothetical protein JTE90_008943 [Oedothorax gibbosus]|uniref:Uncharacterized protein n=1 Tax=Oedothorax gibbosus TaxID=931172 RepID=A0AAV6UPI2_9ARAC|nr:hypothetical protein JTE90_008943 [Oedothorax gibbosus]
MASVLIWYLETLCDVPCKLTPESPTPEKQREVLNLQRRLQKRMSRETNTDLVFEDFARRRQFSEDND